MYIYLLINPIASSKLIWYDSIGDCCAGDNVTDGVCGLSILFSSMLILSDTI